MEVSAQASLISLIIGGGKMAQCRKFVDGSNKHILFGVMHLLCTAENLRKSL
jgi:hypothetical protein